MEKIAISIIVPVYNVEKYLEKCLDSLKNQTLNNIQIILIDDGSTDNSGEICDKYAYDSRFIVIHNKNQGPSGSRNDGIKRADGEYCMFVDSDDWLELNACENMYNYAKETQADLIIGAHVNESTTGSKERYLYQNNISFLGEVYFDDILVPTLGLIDNKIKNPAKLDKLTPVWSRLYRTSIIKENKIEFIELKKLPSECLQFNFEFCTKSKSAAFLHSIIYHYRRNNAGSVTKPYRDDLWKKWKWWIEHEYSFLKTFEANEQIWKAYYSRICCGIIPLGGNALKLKRVSAIKKEVASFLSQEIYETAWKKFDYSCCPIYWKLFFDSAKNKHYTMFIILSWCMRKILSLRKK